MNRMETQTKTIRESLIAEGKSDEMSTLQPHFVPELTCFKHLDNADNTVTMGSSIGTMKKVSDGSNLRNASDSSTKFYKKRGTAEIECNAEEN